MYKWKIDITLNCGKEITGTYNGEEENSLDVAKVLFEGRPDDVIDLGDGQRTTQYFIKRSEIACMAISVG